MRIVDHGSFEILLPRTKEEADLQMMNMERIGRISHRSEDPDKPITIDSASEFMARMDRVGHRGLWEHSQVEVLFYDVSIGFSREANRHRLFSIVEQSTRYVDMSRADKDGNQDARMTAILPGWRDWETKMSLTDGRELSPREMMGEIEEFYRTLRDNGWRNEEARQFLPLGLETVVNYTGNLREWRTVMELRTDKAAHPEMRINMINLLENGLRPLFPVAFADFEKAGEDVHGVPYYHLVKR